MKTLTRIWPLAVVAAVVVLLVPTAAESRRPATASEIRSLTAALSKQIGVPVKPNFVWMSTAVPGWAGVGYGGSKPYSFQVFHEHNGTWTVAGVLIDRGASFDGLCSYMPAAVVNDLFATKCPPYRALHARYASPALRATFTAALRADPATRRQLAGSPFHLINACVSQLDSNWAGGAMVLPDTSIIVWFHKTASGWRPVYFNPQPHGKTIPPRAIILSVARCVSYNPTEYGA